MLSAMTAVKYGLYVTLILGFIFGIAFPWLGLKSGSEPLLDKQPSRAFEDIVIDSEGLRLEGWWMPATNPRAIVLFVHGAGSSRFSPFFNTLGFYDHLNSQGISVLTFDQRNHGNSEYTDGYLRMGATEYRDLQAANRWLQNRKSGDVPVIVCGLSMGGATAIYAIANGMSADGLLLFDPMLNTYDALAQGGYVGYGLPPALFKPMAWLAPRFWSLPKGENDALRLGADLSLPIHIVQNKDDPITRAVWSETLAKNNSSATLTYVPRIEPDHPCLADKGRWGTHASSYHCHPEWTMAEVERLLSRL